MDLLMEGEESFFDPITEALQKTVQIYSTIETIRLNNRLARARESAANYNTPTPTQDAQAKASSMSEVRMTNPLIIGVVVLLGAAALYVIVK